MAVSGSVNAEVRRERILELLRAHGQVRLEEAAQLWDIHPMTVRRDFDQLQRDGLARRVRGGLVAIASDSFAQRRTVNLAAKRRIAQKMLGLVPADAAIGLDSSTTVLPLAGMLPDDARLSVVTNGLEAFEVLRVSRGIRSFLTGGEHVEQDLSLVGPLTIQSLQTFHLECCFLSALSVHSAVGTSESALEQAAVKDAMVRSSARTVLGVDAGKLETRSQVRSLQWAQVDVLITELDPADSRLDAYRDVVSTIL